MRVTTDDEVSLQWEARLYLKVIQAFRLRLALRVQRNTKLHDLSINKLKERTFYIAYHLRGKYKPLSDGTNSLGMGGGVHAKAGEEDLLDFASMNCFTNQITSNEIKTILLH